MEVVVTALDKQYGEMIQQIWSELARDFGVRATSTQVPIPHLSYQGATTYDREEVEGVSSRLAGEFVPFTVETDGLGIFTGPVPILYLAVIRSPSLTQLHHQLWQAITPSAVEATPVFSPERWIPHITLAQGDLTSAELAAIIERFSSRRFQWQIPLTNLAVISNSDSEGSPYSLRFRVELGNHT
jgi:2'-5' RNA ligase